MSRDGLRAPYTQETQQRYRLRLDGAHLTDRFYQHPSGFIRMITYHNDHRTTDDRNVLKASGLLLGVEIAVTDDSTIAFRIPHSSRPTQHDTALEESAGMQSFSDHELFLSAGIVLGSLTTLLHGKSVRNETPISQTFSLIDFAKEGEPYIYLTPGIERVLTKGMPASVEDYADRMNMEFPTRFPACRNDFTSGFHDARPAGR